MAKRPWNVIIDRARTIVMGYSYLITLRQLHYLLFSAGIGYTNTLQDYKRLSSLTAELRREPGPYRGRMFPALLDQTRHIDIAEMWEDPADATRWLLDQYWRIRAEGQSHLVVLGGEKATLLAQLRQWFQPLGMPIVLLRGYGSQTYVDDVRRYVLNDKRPAILIYGGDFDPSGLDIERDFLSRCDVWDDVIRIAVDDTQVPGLPVQDGKPQDSRALDFVSTYDALHTANGLGWSKIAYWTAGGRRVSGPTPIQVELEAIPPNDLRDLYQAEIDNYWDTSVHQAVLDQEEEDKKLLEAIADAVEAGKLYLDPVTGKLRKSR